MSDEPEVGSVKFKSAKTTHSSQFSWESGSEDEESTSTHGAGVSSGPNPSHSKPWYVPGLQFPCPLDNHKHELTVLCISS